MLYKLLSFDLLCYATTDFFYLLLLKLWLCRRKEYVCYTCSFEEVWLLFIIVGRVMRLRKLPVQLKAESRIWHSLFCPGLPLCVSLHSSPSSSSSSGDEHSLNTCSGPGIVLGTAECGGSQDSISDSSKEEQKMSKKKNKYFVYLFQMVKNVRSK